MDEPSTVASGLQLEFEWDETKRLANIKKHGFDFLGAKEIFAGPTLRVKSRAQSSETRWIAIGMLGAASIAVIYTVRAGRLRIISARRARHDETRAYHTALSR